MNRLPGLSIGRTGSRTLSALDVGMSSDQVGIQDQNFSIQEEERSLQDKDLILYTLAIRCSLHPYAFDPSKKLIGGSTGNALLIMRQIFTCGLGDPITNKFNPGGYENLAAAIKNFIKEHPFDENDVFVSAMKKYYDFLKNEAPSMLKSERYHVSDFLTIFSKKIREELDHFPQVAPETFEHYVQRFVTLTTGKEFSVSDLPPSARTFVRSNSSPIFKKRRSAISSYELTSSSTPEASAEFLTTDDLQRIFGVSNHQHQIVLESELLNPFPESVLRELRLRMFLIDNHPVYNKDGFLQKTGAFLQWKAKETEKILKLVEKLKQKNAADRNQIEDFEESMDPNSPKRIEWLGRMLVTVIEAQSLQGKGGKKNRKYYCTVKVKDNALRTRTVQEAENPYWNEQFFVDISDYNETFQLKVWQDRGESSKFSELLSDHKATGKIVIPLNDLRNFDGGIIDKWYDLRKGSERIYSTGKIHLRIQVLHFDKSFSSTLLNFHGLFDSLSQKVFAFSRDHPETGARDENFLDEFGKRYGIRRFYRMTRQIELILQDQEQVPTKRLDFSAIQQLLSKVNPERIKLTQLEYSKWIYCAKAVLERFTDALEHFREVFPQANPPGDLGSLLSSLNTLFHDRMLQNEMEWNAPDFRRFSFNLVKSGTEGDYDALMRATEPVGMSYTIDDEIQGFIALVHGLRHLLENDLLYYNEAFSWYINLPEATVSALVPQLLHDLSGALQYNEDGHSKHILSLLVALKQFHADCLRVVPEEESGLLGLFDFSLFEPHIQRVLLETQERCSAMISALTVESLPILLADTHQPACADSLPGFLELLGMLRDHIVLLSFQDLEKNLEIAGSFLDILRLQTTQFAGSLLSSFLEAFVSPVLSKDNERFFSEEEEFEIPPQFGTFMETIDQLHHFIQQSEPLIKTWIEGFCKATTPSSSQASLITSLGEQLKISAGIFEAIMEEIIQNMVTHMAVTLMNKFKGALSTFTSVDIPKIFSQNESGQTLEKQRQFAGSIIYYLNRNVSAIADAVHGKELETHFLSLGLKVLWKRLSAEFKVLFLKGVQKPYTEKQMKFFALTLKEVRDLFVFFENQQSMELPKMEWWEKVIHWNDLPTNRLIPKTFNKLGKEDSDLILCLINSRTKKEKMASSFVKEQLENSKRILKWSRFLERNSSHDSALST